MNANNPTPEKLASYGFKRDEDDSRDSWRRYDSKSLWYIQLYEKGFLLTISQGYPERYAMRFTPWAPRFFDDLMLSMNL